MNASKEDGWVAGCALPGAPQADACEAADSRKRWAGRARGQKNAGKKASRQGCREEPPDRAPTPVGAQLTGAARHTLVGAAVADVPVL